MEFTFVEPDKRILYMDNRGGVVIGGTDFCSETDRTFDIAFEELATNEELLNAINLVSLYANGEVRGKKYAITFFVSYLGSFYNDDGVRQQLERNPTLRILVQDAEKLKKVTEIFGRTK